MAPSPACAQIVGELPDDRIDQRVQEYGGEDEIADGLRRQVHDLIVEQQQEGLEPVVLDAEGDGAKAIEHPRLERPDLALQFGDLGWGRNATVIPVNRTTQRRPISSPSQSSLPAVMSSAARIPELGWPREAVNRTLGKALVAGNCGTEGPCHPRPKKATPRPG